MSQAQALHDARLAQGSHSPAYMAGYLDGLQTAFGEPRDCEHLVRSYRVRSADHDAMRYGQTEGEADARDAKALEFFKPKQPSPSKRRAA